MALADILAAIDSDAKEHISLLRRQHQQRMAELKRFHEEKLRAFEQSLAHEFQKKSMQMQAKAETLIAQRRTQALTEKQHELLKETYTALLAKLKNLPEHDVKKVLERAVEALGNKPGILRAAKHHARILEELIAKKPYLSLGEPLECVGGFRLESATLEQDFTFESIVRNILAPKSDLRLIQTLFT